MILNESFCKLDVAEVDEVSPVICRLLCFVVVVVAAAVVVVGGNDTVVVVGAAAVVVVVRVVS
jgi:hypothetical protein